jgi:hypothetical protein
MEQDESTFKTLSRCIQELGWISVPEIDENGDICGMMIGNHKYISNHGAPLSPASIKRKHELDILNEKRIKAFQRLKCGDYNLTIERDQIELLKYELDRNLPLEIINTANMLQSEISNDITNANINKLAKISRLAMSLQATALNLISIGIVDYGNHLENYANILYQWYRDNSRHYFP